MVRKIECAALVGIQAVRVVIEVDSSLGLPGFSMVGLPDTAVRESRERVVSALRSAGFQAMGRRITVNLAPADLRKEGCGFDLALAIGMLWATDQLEWNPVRPMLFVGELSLDGILRPVRGAISIGAYAKEAGFILMVPHANLAEVSAIDGLECYGVENLGQCVAFLRGEAGADRGCASTPKENTCTSSQASIPDFASVQGMSGVRRALEIAAAGWHHFLLVGSPGSGKTLCAQCMPGILPPLTQEEALETTMIHSCAGLLAQGEGLLQKRPFRAPHHTASPVSLMGGGKPVKPGEISLAHNGLLFLDEFPEFSRAGLEGLRQPLESASISIARAAERIDWPARFLLGAAMNPCPCGFSADPKRECLCSPQDIARYRLRLSGPMLDRIDLQIRVPVQTMDYLQQGISESSAEMASRIRKAVQIQRSRNGMLNGRLPSSDLRKLCSLGSQEEAFLKKAGDKMNLSMRGAFRGLKVARTIADLEGKEKIKINHLAEALQYRLP